MPPFDLAGSILLFALAAMMTPGPNNVMLLTSGANFGFRRTLPHMAGITAGFGSLLVAVGLGVGSLVTTFPAVHLALKIAGGAYLLYLAWRIATTRKMARETADGQPLTFVQAAVFQWINPKAWVIGLTGLSLFADPRDPVGSIAVMIVLSLIVSIGSVVVWTACGEGLGRYLAEPVRLKWFNIVMGALLAISVVPLVA